MEETERLLNELKTVLKEFEKTEISYDVRNRVLALIPVLDTVRALGKSLLPNGLSLSARDRLLTYFLTYPKVVLSEKELALVAGISEWARRIRELRVQYGWKIITGMTAKQMADENDLAESDIDLNSLGSNDYILLEEKQDREAAFRWNLANEIRKGKGGGRDKILQFLRRNVGKPVTGEELSYVAKSTEWARRTRELRTEEGWPISTKMSGNPLLPIGVYVLEEDRQTPVHDRNIPEKLRRDILRRDEYTCQKCSWNYDLWNPSDPRFLEIHHITHHSRGGRSEPENLVTYCNICHDEVHRLENRLKK